MTSDRMDKAVFPVFRRSVPVNGLVLPALCGKSVRSFGYPRDIIRMGIAIHVVIHQTICFTEVIEAEELTETP